MNDAGVTFFFSFPFFGLTANLLLVRYVAVHAMQDDGHGHGDTDMNGFADPSAAKGHGPQVRDTFATVGGMLLPLLTQIGHH